MLIAWIAVMAVLVNRSYVQATGNLATDLARYGSSAQWRGVYYRGEKLGFTVSQTVPVGDGEGGNEEGFELQEDGQLQMTLLGAHTITTLRTTARVNRAFELQSFEFSLDPGTGPITIGGVVRDLDLHISITSGGRTRTEVRRLPERPMLTLNLVRRLADEGLTPGCGPSMERLRSRDAAKCAGDGKSGRARNRALGQHFRYLRFASRWNSPG